MAVMTDARMANAKHANVMNEQPEPIVKMIEAAVVPAIYLRFSVIAEPWSVSLRKEQARISPHMPIALKHIHTILQPS